MLSVAFFIVMLIVVMLSVVMLSVVAPFVSEQFFRASLIFLSKGRAHHTGPCFCKEAPCLTHKHYTRLEKLARDKHTSLFG